jgi:hypothetical protein
VGLFYLYNIVSEISGCHGDQYRDDGLLRYGAMAIALMMEAVRTSETSVYFNDTTWPIIPKGCHLQHKYGLQIKQRRSISLTLLQHASKHFVNGSYATEQHVLLM